MLKTTRSRRTSPRKTIALFRDPVLMARAASISAAGITVIALVAFGAGLRWFALHTDYFSVTEIEVIDRYPDDVDYPLARIKSNPNIFIVDLERIARNLEREHVDIQRATVRRIFPNKLQVEVVRRAAVAQMCVSGTEQNQPADYYFTVNQEGYVLTDLGTNADPDLPIIFGAGLLRQELEPGRCYRRSRLRWATDLLIDINKTAFAQRYRISRIDVTQPRALSFTIDNYLEVVIGNQQWPDKVAQLLAILPGLPIDPAQSYHLDIRFKDIVFTKK